MYRKIISNDDFPFYNLHQARKINQYLENLAIDFQVLLLKIFTD